MRHNALNPRQPAFYDRQGRMHYDDQSNGRGYKPPSQYNRWQRFRRWFWSGVIKRRHFIGACVEALVCFTFIAAFTGIFYWLINVLVP